MMLSDIADAARSSGLPVMEHAGWQTRGHGPMSGVRSIICHHTAGPAVGELPSLNTVVNGRRDPDPAKDLPGPLAQLMLGRSGTVYVIAAGLSYHAGVVDSNDHSNAYSIGIEAEATGVDPWPMNQYTAYIELCAALARWYKLPVSAVLGHKEVARPVGRKTDPNFDMGQFRSLVADIMNGDDVLTQADKDWMTATFARRVDLGYARDQIMLSLGFDPTASGPVVGGHNNPGLQPARKGDVDVQVSAILAAIKAGPDAKTV